MHRKLLKKCYYLLWKLILLHGWKVIKYIQSNWKLNRCRFSTSTYTGSTSFNSTSILYGPGLWSELTEVEGSFDYICSSWTITLAFGSSCSKTSCSSDTCSGWTITGSCSTDYNCSVAVTFEWPPTVGVLVLHL
jgi:hypothetical protein